MTATFWVVENVAEAVCWVFLFVGFSIQLYFDWAYEVSNKKKITNLKWAFHRLGWLMSLLGMVRAVDPLGSYGILPWEVGVWLIYDMAVLMLMGATLSYYVAIDVAYTTLRTKSPWINRYKYTFIFINTLSALLGNIMMPLQLSGFSNDGFWTYGIFILLIGITLGAGAIVWDMATWSLWKMYTGQSIGNYKRRTRQALDRLLKFQLAANIATFIIIPVNFLIAFRSIGTEYERIDPDSSFNPRVVMICGPLATGFLMLYMAWRPPSALKESSGQRKHQHDDGRSDSVSRTSRSEQRDRTGSTARFVKGSYKRATSRDTRRKKAASKRDMAAVRHTSSNASRMTVSTTEDTIADESVPTTTTSGDAYAPLTSDTAPPLPDVQVEEVEEVSQQEDDNQQDDPESRLTNQSSELPDDAVAIEMGSSA